MGGVVVSLVLMIEGSFFGGVKKKETEEGSPIQL